MAIPTDSWHDSILREFSPTVPNVTLVADPDSLLTEEELLLEIQARGLNLVPFEEPIAFRFIYESKYRERIERGEPTNLVIVLNAEADKLRSLPYDVLRVGRQLSFSLNELFPNLSYPVVKTLERSHLDALYRAQTQYKPGRLRESATQDFILRHVFQIAPEFINQTSDLLLALLRRHYRNQRVPAILDERFIQLLRECDTFQDWPLKTIISDRQAFFTFLQEHWPIFVRRQLSKSKLAAEATGTYVTPTQANLPFDSEDVRGYINHLFIEGYLQPVSVDNLEVASLKLGANEWLRVGLLLDPAGDRRQRLHALLQALDKMVSLPEPRHQDWLNFAYSWAELVVLWQEIKTTEVWEKPFDAQQQRISALQEKVDKTFLAWARQQYGGLYNQPALKTPVMLHQIPRVLARHLEELKTQKVALLVLDGLALDQWFVLREVLLAQRPQLKFRTDAAFAWVPTITSVSRQALFAGKLPLYFPGSIHNTDKEAKLWMQYWTDFGLTPVEIAYAKGLGENASLGEVLALLSRPKVRAVGLVVDKVDKIMHGMVLGTAGMHNQVRQWAREGFIIQLLDALSERGFSVFLTSDHGNIEATGIGRPSEGAIADLRGERVRLYPDHTLRAKVKVDFPDAIDWPSIGLPEDCLPLLAPGRSAFIPEGERIVGHGGISIEELIVPFVQIENIRP